MNNQQAMDNYLLILKSTIEVYVHGTLESSNQDIRELLKSGLNETLTYILVHKDEAKDFTNDKVDTISLLAPLSDW